MNKKQAREVAINIIKMFCKDDFSVENIVFLRELKDLSNKKLAKELTNLIQEINEVKNELLKKEDL